MRETRTLTYGWKFQKTAPGFAGEAPGLDDSGWETVRVPHDWAIGEDFDENNDVSFAGIAADGLTPQRHTGRTGGLPSVGEGWYRLRFQAPAGCAGDKVLLNFDGVMWRSEIYVNGVRVGGNHYGYRAFEVDITGQIRQGEINLLAVHAVVAEDCSRWYCGGGLFREVTLTVRSADGIATDGIWFRTLSYGENYADMALTLECEGEGNRAVCTVTAPGGEQAACFDFPVSAGEQTHYWRLTQPPQLWSTGKPLLYTAHITLYADDKPTDSDSVRFGIRTIAFDAAHGFLLNGVPTKLKGICNHHDLGLFGAAFNTAAQRRQVEKLKEMGLNAWRTSHNPPARRLLDLLDEMGIVCMLEFFDEWGLPKVKNGYAAGFAEHAAEDVAAIMHRDRNHPCVVLWSIGNEIEEQRTEDGWKTARFLTDTVHRLDASRPVTAGLNYGPEAFTSGFFRHVDVVGMNYKPQYYETYLKLGCPVIGSETASCVSTRGVYDLPAEAEIPVKPRPDLTVSSYELCAPCWAYYPEREFAAQDRFPAVGGEFVWTGFDYLGEPTPYYAEWPSRSSYFGIFDLAGMPKDRYWLYRSQWSDSLTVHLLPHWNWAGHEGQTVPVHCFTNADSAELFVNGVSQGVRRRDSSDEIRAYRLIWENTVYEPGEIRAVAYDAEGKILGEDRVVTAGAPAGLRLTAERRSIAADGEDVCYFIAEIVDAAGNLCPLAENLLTFACRGAELVGSDNGDPRGTISLQKPQKPALAGKCAAAVRSVAGVCGSVTVTVSAIGLGEASAVIESV